MEVINLPLILMLIAAGLVFAFLINIIKIKRKTQLHKLFLVDMVCVLVINIGAILQQICCNIWPINPMFFENFIYIGTCFLPIGIFLTGLTFTRTKIKITKKYMLLGVIPVISLLVLWTNQYHHLFYEQYSIYINETKTGAYVIVHYLYTYSLIGIGIFEMLYSSIKNSGFFSKQSILILVGILIPITVNVIFTFNLFNLNTSVYATPISFSIAVLFFFMAVIKYKFLGVAPIAIQKIVDRISDSYIVLNDDDTITDYNKPFMTTFEIKERKEIRGKNIEKFLKEENLYFDLKTIKEILPKVKESTKTLSYELYINKLDKFFNVEINSIFSKEQSLGILILFKDITQHKKDMEIIQNNQSMLIERERLASLGQMIGGVAHNLKTPIMSIAGAAEGISDLIKEYELSVGNPQVTVEDHHAIASDMKEWVGKIKTYTEYMSDIITAVKGQAVNFSEEEIQDFTVEEIVKRVNILMKHELKNAVIYLNTEIKCNESITVKGNINSLVQVINNMISNAIQAYNGEPEKQIDMIVDYKDKKVIISIKDYGPGLPDKVKEKLFKEMITTKGKNGSGLGLYMSYSNIKAHFRGDIKVETEKGKGTKFDIIIPV